MYLFFIILIHYVQRYKDKRGIFDYLVGTIYEYLLSPRPRACLLCSFTDTHVPGINAGYLIDRQFHAF